MVHFVGDMSGSSPTDLEVANLLKRHPDLKMQLPPLGIALDEGKAISYTHWEAWLALYFHKNLEVVAPAPSGKHGRKPKTLDSSRTAQSEHLARLRALGIYPNQRFTNQHNLIAQILNASVIKALVRAEAIQVHQPRNLPFASLGPLFMGRDSTLNNLRVALVASKGAAVVGRALHGLGGVGKTRLAIEYALRHEADYSALLFVPGDDPVTLNAGLAALAGANVLNVPEREARQDAVKIEAAVRWLDVHPTWLMILDNVDDQQAVAAVVSLMARLKGGHVIVTGRATNFPGSVRKLELGVLDDEAATAFLTLRTREDRATAPDDEAQARRLANELGNLALELEQAGAYIAVERIGLGRYLGLWHEKRESVLKWFDKALMSYNHDVGLAATWATSVEKLTSESRRLLDRLAFFAPDPIPDSLIDIAVPGEAANYNAQTARAGLYAYSLITRATGEDGAGKGFVMHRLVQDFARRAMNEERSAEALRQALWWVNAAFVGSADDVRNWPVLDPLAPHALARRADEEVIADPIGSLFNRLALLSYAKARYAEAESLYRRGLTIDEARYGRDHPEVATDLINLAELLRQTNRFGEAEPLVRRALTIDEASYGPDHPEVATDLRDLANLLRETNRIGDAEPLARRALSIDEASYGPDHPSVARDLSNLSRLLYATNRFGEAEPLYRRALAIDEANFGPDHAHVASTLCNLALLLRATNRISDAEPLFRRSLAIFEKSLGPDHPDVATNLDNLGSLLMDAHRFNEAEPLYRRALPIFEKSLGPDHPYIAMVLHNVATLFRATNRPGRPSRFFGVCWRSTRRTTGRITPRWRPTWTILLTSSARRTAVERPSRCTAARWQSSRRTSAQTIRAP